MPNDMPSSTSTAPTLSNVDSVVLDCCEQRVVPHPIRIIFDKSSEEKTVLLNRVTTLYHGFSFRLLTPLEIAESLKLICFDVDTDTSRSLDVKMSVVTSMTEQLSWSTSSFHIENIKEGISLHELLTSWTEFTHFVSTPSNYKMFLLKFFEYQPTHFCI